uniref:Deoxynucleotidyltransferase terminal-interacting protein 1 n=1 Tax=Balaenoptera musculus TaxID=9771 RepID=A0A8C0DCV5_BALMU
MGATGDAEQPRGPGGAERGGPELGDAGAAGQLVLTNPWNIMIKHRQVQRRGRRSQMTTSFTDPAISMDLLRAVLQPSINEEIQTVFNKYMKFFQKAALNVRDNVGEEVDAEQLIQEACRSCLEQRGRQAEDECAHRGKPIPKKRKGRPPGHILSSDRSAAGMVWKPKSCEPIRREGPKWDPARLNESTTFVLGSRANNTQLTPRTSTGWPSSITCGQQGGRWPTSSLRRTSGTSLPAMTTGKTCPTLPWDESGPTFSLAPTLLLNVSSRGCLDLKLEELKSFVLPSWMVEKMRKYMETLRTENEHRAVEAPLQT